MKRDDVIGGAMLLIGLVAIGAFFLFAPNGPELSYGPVELLGSKITATVANGAEVDTTATLIKPGYITVHESIGEAPGPVIGVSGYIEVGEDVSVKVMLSQPMTAGLTYIALLHVDNGDEHFVITDDMPVTNGGESVRANVIGL